ncbi:DUF3618 domain-containing protein [Micromonospora sp. AMSO1212t]|uniref:DUF3618 domain-containing protein n=1 Tax=Micromonospora sp. AMSO1212t TaxID=2650565 RepID=UPI00124B0006|nr:DUF3618 domain-containing protein [Micromonospora sp. AMSO1212t]KAB1909267.1 DUF3618 domain-containing protein [Micromonospora sp. AMSO1212t]
MSNDPDRIRHDIETTRTDLSNDVDALAYKASPRRLAGTQVYRARSGLSRLLDRVMGTARHAGHSTRHQSAAMGQRMSGMAQHGVEMTSGRAHQAAGAMSSVGHRGQALGHASRERAESNPLAAGLVAFGVGLLAASLAPSTRKEHDLAERAKHQVMEHSDQIKQRAGGMAHQVQDNLREPTQHATEAVRSAAAEGAATVRDTGRDEAQRVRDDAREAPRRL